VRALDISEFLKAEAALTCKSLVFRRLADSAPLPILLYNAPGFNGLALEPELLLLDEPTAGMSLEEVPAVIALIEAIRRRGDTTILLVEHKIDMVMALSDSIAVLKDGRLIADDAPRAIAGNPEVQAAYFGGGAARA